MNTLIILINILPIYFPCYLPAAAAFGTSCDLSVYRTIDYLSLVEMQLFCQTKRTQKRFYCPAWINL